MSFLSPLRGLVPAGVLPTARAVGCILAPLRGWFTAACDGLARELRLWAALRLKGGSVPPLFCSAAHELENSQRNFLCRGGAE